VLELAALAVAAFFVATGAGDLIFGVAARELSASDLAADTGSIGARATDERPVDSGSARLAGDAVLARNIFDSQVGPIVPGGSRQGGVPLADDDDTSALLPCDERGLDLLATVSAGSDRDGSFALLDNGGDVTYRAAGDAVGDRTVEAIGWRYVLLKDEAGRRCYLDLHGSSRTGARPRSRTPGSR